jgi:hypothetical protein
MTIILLILLLVMSLMCKNQKNLESKISDIKHELSRVVIAMEQQRKIEIENFENYLRKA